MSVPASRDENVGTVCEALAQVIAQLAPAGDPRLACTEAEALLLAGRISTTIAEFLAERDRVVRATVQIARDEPGPGGESTMTGH